MVVTPRDTAWQRLVRASELFVGKRAVARSAAGEANGSTARRYFGATASLAEIWRVASACLASCWLLACTPIPSQMRYQVDGVDAAATPTWPSPPQQPRLEFAGVLTGEANFGPSEQTQPNAGQRFVRWLVGLGAGSHKREKVLLRPQSGTVDERGRILVTDVGRAAVFVFDDQNGQLSIWDEAAARTKFDTPIGIANGRPGEVLIADAGLARVVRLDNTGTPLGSIGDGELRRPTGLCRDALTGLSYVVDTATHDIKVFDDDGRLVNRFGGRGDALGKFNAPTHIALAGRKLYVTDTLNARVQVLTTSGTPLGAIGQRGLYVGNLTRPKGVAADRRGNVYIVESYYDHLLIFDAQGRFLLPIGGNGTGIGQFFLPAGAWVDQRDRIFVADMFNGRVIVFQYLDEWG